MNLNKVIIVGRVTAQPELRQIPSGASVTSFSIATNRVWTDKGGAKQEETEFHNVVAWGRQAEIASQYLTKGALVLIEGRLRTRSWEDKQGNTRRTTEIIIERLQLGPKPKGASAGSPQGFSGQAAQAGGGAGSDPFSDSSDSAGSGGPPGGGQTPAPSGAGQAEQVSGAQAQGTQSAQEEIPVVDVDAEEKDEVPF